MKMECL